MSIVAEAVGEVKTIYETKPGDAYPDSVSFEYSKNNGYHFYLHIHIDFLLSCIDRALGKE